MGRVRFQDSLAYRIQRTARVLRKHFLDLGAQAGVDLTPEQWFMLNKLDHEDGQNPVALCDEIFVDRPNITRMLLALEEKGYVRRLADPEDGRKLRVFLTRAGRDAHDRFSAAVPDARRALFRGISPDELATAERVLKALERNLTGE